MHILIVDDEELARERLKRLLEGLPDCKVIGEAVNGQDALEKINTLDPELVFLDVRMPVMDGIAVAKTLVENPDPPAIVFCTAYDEYALEAFDTFAQGYIVKPVQTEQLQQVIQKAKTLTRVQSRAIVEEEAEKATSRRHISAKTRKGMELIPIDNVHCFIADQKYVTVVHNEGETLIDDTLKDLENEFEPRFVRVHRNALVAVGRIEALERDSAGRYALRLNNSEYRPSVSRRHLAGVRSLLSSL